MKEQLKQQLHALVDSIEDEAKLQLLMEDAEAYLADTDEEDDLSEEELAEIKAADKRIDNGEYDTLEDTFKLLREWKEK